MFICREGGVEKGETGKTYKESAYELGHWDESAVLCGLREAEYVDALYWNGIHEEEGVF